jgi:hypothetical protein
MSSFDPPSSSQEPLNPYAAPLSDVGGPSAELEVVDDSSAETIRRLYLGHEAGIKSIGSLHYLGAFFSLLVVLATIVILVNSAQGDMRTQGALVVLFVYGLVTALNYALGYGLRHLLTWARWTEAVFLLLGTLVTLVGMIGLFAIGRSELAVGYIFVLLIYSYILYLLLSAKGTMVFSPGYKEIIEKTPHIKYKTSVIVKIAIGFFVTVVMLGVIAAIVGEKR